MFSFIICIDSIVNLRGKDTDTGMMLAIAVVDMYILYGINLLVS